jgi:hypothetical protein
MSIFKRRTETAPAPIVCVICSRTLAGPGATQSHWMSHLQQIPPGQGDASGQYTWNCACGSSEMKWPGTAAAALAMDYHMHRAHGVPGGDQGVLGALDRMPAMRHLSKQLS